MMHQLKCIIRISGKIVVENYSSLHVSPFMLSAAVAVFAE